MNLLAQQGIEAARAGKRALAQDLLLRALRQDRTNVDAWLWLSEVVDSDQEKLECLEYVVVLQPHNLLAWHGIEILRRRIEAQAEDGIPSTTSTFSDAQPFIGEEETGVDIQGPEPASLPAGGPSTPAGDWVLPESDGWTPESNEVKEKRANKSWILIAGAVAVMIIAAAFFFAFHKAPQAPEPPLPAMTPVVKTEIPTLMALQAISPLTQLTSTANGGSAPALPKATRTPLATATFSPPGERIARELTQIGQQVSSVRGLNLNKPVAVFILTKNEVEDALKSEVDNEALAAQLEKERLVLRALGMIHPEGDLMDLAMNRLVDHLGGIYLPDRRQVLIIGFRFTGIERFIYSHEIDHALVDQNFGLNTLENREDCERDRQRCHALEALMEGDAMLVMKHWLQIFASKQDYHEAMAYAPLIFPLGTGSPPPPFAEADALFPYIQGEQFVNALFTRGGWDAVNQAYTSPPETTEQILHPQKYFTHEPAVIVASAPVGEALGPGWQKVDEGVLGEWTTYLMLGYPADVLAQLDTAGAARAADGWGGDRYQVFYHAGQNATALAARWIWDTPTEARDFQAALSDLLGARYRGEKAKLNGASCWKGSQGAACLFARGSETLWLAAPDIDAVARVMAQYPEFQ